MSYTQNEMGEAPKPPKPRLENGIEIPAIIFAGVIIYVLIKVLKNNFL